MSTITSLEALRNIVGKPHEMTANKLHTQLTEQARQFIARAPLLFIATSNKDGIPTVSPKGDPAGFVSVENDGSLLLPERPGNKLLLSFENLLSNPGIGLIFVIPGMEETLRVTGQAELIHDEALNQRFSVNNKPAILVTKVTVQQCFFHCAKAFKRSKSWQPEYWPEPFKVSFGEELAGKAKGIKRKAMTSAIDLAVKADYKKNLY